MAGGLSDIIIPEGAAALPLTRGLHAIVDEADFDWLSQWKWCASSHRGGRSYATRRSRRDALTFYMHREIVVPLAGLVVDHINGNALDNRRSNLRQATFSQNAANTRVVQSATGYRGVIFNRRRGLFAARCTVDGKRNWLGYFHAAEDAARAYDAFLLKAFGAYASLNFPEAA